MGRNGPKVVEVAEHEHEQKQDERELVEQVHREAIERGLVQPLPPYEPPTIHYSELPEGSADSPIAGEWTHYRREVSRLLAEGHENKWVLIKGEEIIGIWETEAEADQIRLQRFLLQPVLLKQICVREAVHRGGGHYRPWRS